MTPPAPLSCAAFLLTAFTLAGLVQTVWLRSRRCPWLRVPLDGGRSWAGKRIFGDNKTWHGLVALVPAVGAAFVLLSLVWAGGLWPLSPAGYGLLGCWVGLGFMLGELPNSFLKRRLDIGPGDAPSRPWARVLCFVGDRLDSILGAFLALALVVPTSPAVLLYLLLLGPAVHWSFSVLLFHLGVKRRPA